RVIGHEGREGKGGKRSVTREFRAGGPGRGGRIVNMDDSRSTVFTVHAAENVQLVIVARRSESTGDERRLGDRLPFPRFVREVERNDGFVPDGIDGPRLLQVPAANDIDRPV